MAIVNFVSCQYIKEHTTIEENVDDSLLTPYIIKVQDTHIQQVLGSSFMDHLYSAVTNSTLTTAEESLIRDYIQRTVAEYVFYEAYPFISFKSTNKGTQKQNSEWSTSAELSEIKFIRSAILDMAQFYLSRLVKYMCDHSADFPAYLNPTLPQNVDKSRKAFFGGVYLEKRNNNGIRTYDEDSNSN